MCEVIWFTLQDQFLTTPKTAAEWQAKAVAFQQRWDYPHCVGAIDGKHVVVEAPANSGSLYYNYKHTFSMVLLAVVDADYKFTYSDIGAYGKQSDGGVFSASSLGLAFAAPNNQLSLAEDSVIDGADHLGPVPYVIVADEAFPLQRHMMRPFPGKSSTLEQDAYNYRHSRARRVVENAFGILSEWWRVYHTKITVLPESVKKLDMATTVLHNMLQRQRGASSESTDAADSHVQQAAALQPLHRMGSRGTNAAIDIRNKFSQYFTEYPLPWQNSYVRRGLSN